MMRQLLQFRGPHLRYYILLLFIILLFNFLFVWPGHLTILIRALSAGCSGLVQQLPGYLSASGTASRFDFIDTPFVTVIESGRLGNHMFQYAALVGIAVKNQMIPVLRCRAQLYTAFQISVQQATLCDDTLTLFSELGDRANSFDESAFHLQRIPGRNYVLRGYYQSWKYFEHVRERIQRDFQLLDSIAVRAKVMFEALVRNAHSNATFVGVHIRRGDKVGGSQRRFGDTVAPTGYYLRAMNHMRRLLAARGGGRPHFLICSDDIRWARQKLGRLQDNMGADVDEALQYAGEFGPYQRKRVLALSAMQVWVGSQFIQAVLTGATPGLSEASIRCVTGSGRRYAGCSPPAANGSHIECASYEVENSPKRTIVTEWALVCGEEYQTKLMTSVLMFGVLFGNLIGGQLADRFGRLPMFYGCALLCTLFSASSALASSAALYCASRLLTGVAGGAWGMICFVLATELVGPSKRTLCNSIFMVFFPVGIMLSSLLAYLLVDWRWFCAITSLPGLVCLAFIGFLPESPRWLFAAGRIQKAEQVLSKFAEQNRGRNNAERRIILAPSGCGPTTNSDTAPSALVLFTDDLLRGRTLIGMYTWFVNSAVYYGLTVGAGTLGKDVYASVALSGFVELPAVIGSYFILLKFGRRRTLCLLMFLSGAACFCIWAFGEHARDFRTTLALSGKLCISASFSAIFVYTVELYPTELRSSALGICAVMARVGGILAPLLLPFDALIPALSFAAFGILALSASYLSRYLPETSGQPTHETVQAMKDALVEKAKLDSQYPLSGSDEAWSSDQLVSLPGQRHP